MNDYETAVRAVFICLALSPAIALLDWRLFAKDKKKEHWTNWLPATFIELSCFLMGLLAGKVLL